MKHFLFLFISFLPLTMFAEKSNISDDVIYQKLITANNQVQQGNYSQALPELIYLKNYYEQSTNFEEYNYCVVVMGLCWCYLNSGNLSELKSTITQALDIYKTNGCKVNSDYTRQLWLWLANTEGQLKNYDTSLKYYQHVKSMLEEDHDFGDSFLVVLTHMGSLYMAMNNYTLAIQNIEESLTVFERIYGYSIFETKNPEHLMILNQYALLNLRLEKYDEAERCFKTIIDFPNKYSVSLGAVSTILLQARNNLAVIYIMKGQWKDAYQLLEYSGQIDNQEINYEIEQNKLLCTLLLNDKQKSLELLNIQNDIANNNALSVFSHFSEDERDNYWSHLSWVQLLVNNLVANHTQNDGAIGVAYDNMLFCRTLMQGCQYMIEKYSKTQNNDILYQHYQYYKTLKSKLSYKELNKDERIELSQKLINLEHEILLEVPNLWNEIRAFCGSWYEIKECLDDNEIAIDFTYIPIISSWPDNKRYYGAFILKKDYKSPKLVLIEEETILHRKIIYDDSDEIQINTFYDKKNMNDIYRMLFNNLSSYIGNVSTIYYSPTGCLLNINFDLLLDDDGKELGDKVKLVRVASTSDIEKVKKRPNDRFGSACIYGNISYDESITDMENQSIKYDTFSGEDITTTLTSRSINDRGKWGILPYTKNEIDSICMTLQNSSVSAKKYEGIYANEESFKSYDENSPHIIHLSTHGFVVDTQQEVEGNKFIESSSLFQHRERYLTWCGLMMAGSNNAWTGNFNLENVEDGILTADEISRLDLSNTKLVVLSACETARGKIDPVEGVLGLQRAFKKAGAQTIVMSLWKVPDESTSILMTEFYRNLMNGVEIHQALKNAEDKVKELYPDPYYWAGFIILD